MQKEGSAIEKLENNFLKEVQVVVQSMVEAALGIYTLMTGHITLSADGDVSMEAMYCTGEILENMSYGGARLHMGELEAERYECMAKKWEPFDLTYDFLTSCYENTVITECEIHLTNSMTGDILPIQICALKLCFEDGRELDYSDKVSVFVLKNLAEAA